MRQNRNNYFVNYNTQSQIIDSIPNQLNASLPIIDNDLYLLINGENGTGNVTISGTPTNQIPYPSFSGTRAIYSTVDQSIHQHHMINSFTRGFHPGSAFKIISSNTESRTGTKHWFAPMFPSVTNAVYFPKFKFTLDSFVAGCSIKIPRPPANRISSPPFAVSLLGTSWEPSPRGWYTYITVERQVDPTPPYMSDSSGKIIDKNITNKLNLVLHFVYNNSIKTSHVLQNFTYNTWIDLAWSYNNNIVLLSINNDTKAYYGLPKINPTIAAAFDLVLGPIIPDSYRFMGYLDNLYIKKYVA